MNVQPPPRLHVILARRAPLAVVLRRGPTRWVECLLWDRARDDVAPGAWFHGRIYERRCDLSPDGSLFVYFAAKYHAGETSYAGTWTAVSRPPWLTALALWPKGDAWNGGGLFEDERILWVNHGEDGVAAHADHQPVRLTIRTESRGRGEDFPIYGMRLLRDGWSEVKTIKTHLEPGWRIVTTAPGVYERAAGAPSATLRAVFSIDDNRSTWRYSIATAEGEVELTGADWADVDGTRGVVFTREGRIHRLAHGGGEILVADLTGHRPEPRVPPDWARDWPAP